VTLVHLDLGYAAESYAREHPGFPFTIGALRFVAGDGEAADWLVTAQYMTKAIATTVPRPRRIFLVTEPNGYFPARFINQFGIVVSPFAIKEFTGAWIESHPALTSYFGSEAEGSLGTLDYARLAALPVPEKRDAISVVITRKTVMPGHRRRLDFVRRLARALGDRLEIYGRGFRPVADKADVILPVKYHLVLENTVMPFYWTEKLADAFLGHAFPFVSGPPNLTDWFPPESFAPIDIRDADRAIETIRRGMADGLYEKRAAAVAEARRRLIHDERLGPLLARVIAAHPDGTPRLATRETLLAPPRPPLPARVRREVARAWWKLDARARDALAPIRPHGGD
jgi:hypothetical protein